VRGTDARWWGLPTAGHPRTQAVPFARWTEPWSPARYEKRQLPKWTLDRGSHGRAKLATSVGESICSRDLSRA
jgi:hypothetical protein